MERHVEAEVVDVLQDPLPGGGQVVADLGATVEVSPEPDHAAEQVAGFLLERVDGHGAW